MVMKQKLSYVVWVVLSFLFPVLLWLGENFI